MKVWRRVAWLAIGATAMFVVLAVVITLAQTSTLVDLIRNDQKAGIERSKDTKTNTEQIERLAETIKSCTDPEGQCFKDGQARTGEAVASINEVIIYAAACADLPGVDSAPEIRNCIRELLAEHPNPIDVTR